MKPPRLIVADVDGCLLPEESASWPWPEVAELARVVRDLNAGGACALTLCTGRPQPYVECLMKLLDIRVPAIAESGAVIYSLHDNAARPGPGVTRTGVARLRALRDYLEDDVLASVPGAVVQAGKEAQLSVYCGEPARLGAIEQAARGFLAISVGPAIEITRSHYYVNIGIAGVDKGTATAALLAGLGIARDEVVGIGDTEGDEPLRRAVGWFACPANATPALKARADFVASRAGTQGFLEIVERVRTLG